MWIFSAPAGFFSVVQDTHQERLVVRARIRGDLSTLREQFLPELTPTERTPTRDYPYRARCQRDEWASALALMAMAIDYGNFKTDVLRKHGLAREQLYAQVWAVMLDAENKLAAAHHTRNAAPQTRRASSRARGATRRPK